MLQLRNIVKTYETDGLKQDALKGVSISFRENEFVSILGQSGSGKTTMLNIIGGLDRYTDGDLIINGVSTKKYKDGDWDYYRKRNRLPLMDGQYRGRDSKALNGFFGIRKFNSFLQQNTKTAFRLYAKRCLSFKETTYP